MINGLHLPLEEGSILASQKKNYQTYEYLSFTM
jgi:hypothetical protein